MLKKIVCKIYQEGKTFSLILLSHRGGGVRPSCPLLYAPVRCKLLCRVIAHTLMNQVKITILYTQTRIVVFRLEGAEGGGRH